MEVFHKSLEQNAALGESTHTLRRTEPSYLCRAVCDFQTGVSNNQVTPQPFCFAVAFISQGARTAFDELHALKSA